MNKIFTDSNFNWVYTLYLFALSTFRTWSPAKGCQTCNRKSQFGILWPDFMFEWDSTRDSSAVTSQETRRRETYTCNAIESTGVTRQKWQCATSQGTVENSVHARYFEWWKQVTKCDCFTKFIFLKKACGRNVERANKYRFYGIPCGIFIQIDECILLFLDSLQLFPDRELRNSIWVVKTRIHSIHIVFTLIPSLDLGPMRHGNDTKAYCC